MTAVVDVPTTDEEKQLHQALVQLQGRILSAPNSEARDRNDPAYVNLLPKLADALSKATDTNLPAKPEVLCVMLLSEVDARDAAANWAAQAINDYTDHSGLNYFRGVIRRMRKMRDEISSEPESK